MAVNDAAAAAFGEPSRIRGALSLPMLPRGLFFAQATTTTTVLLPSSFQGPLPVSPYAPLAYPRYGHPSHAGEAEETFTRSSIHHPRVSGASRPSTSLQQIRRASTSHVAAAVERSELSIGYGPYDNNNNHDSLSVLPRSSLVKAAKKLMEELEAQSQDRGTNDARGLGKRRTDDVTLDRYDAFRALPKSRTEDATCLHDTSPRQELGLAWNGERSTLAAAVRESDRRSTRSAPVAASLRSPLCSVPEPSERAGLDQAASSLLLQIQRELSDIDECGEPQHASPRSLGAVGLGGGEDKSSRRRCLKQAAKLLLQEMERSRLGKGEAARLPSRRDVGELKQGSLISQTSSPLMEALGKEKEKDVHSEAGDELKGCSGSQESLRPKHHAKVPLPPQVQPQQRASRKPLPTLVLTNPVEKPRQRKVQNSMNFADLGTGSPEDEDLGGHVTSVEEGINKPWPILFGVRLVPAVQQG